MAPRVSETPAILCAVLDVAALGPEPRDFAETLFGVGVDWIQLRDRSVESGSLLEWARALALARRDADKRFGTRALRRRVIMNRRLDIALSAGVDGLHLGFDALDADRASPLLPDGALIGGSLHSVAEVEAAERAPTRLDYIHLAPIWDPNSKPATRSPLGTEALEQACRSTIPILAQGGIDPARAVAAIRAGADGVAVTGAIGRAEGALRDLERLRKALDGQT